MHSGLQIHQLTQNTSYRATEIQQEVTTVSEEYWTQPLHCVVKVCLQQDIPSHFQSHCREVYAIANVSGQVFFKSLHEPSTSQFAPELVISYKLVRSKKQAELHLLQTMQCLKLHVSLVSFHTIKAS